MPWNDKREEVTRERQQLIVAAEQSLRAAMQEVPLFRSYLDAVFEKFRQGRLKGSSDKCKFHLVLSRTVTGTQEHEEWRPGGTETWSSEYGESLVLTADLKLLISNRLHGWVGGASDPWEGDWGLSPGLSSDKAWKSMHEVLQRLDRPTAALEFLGELLRVELCPRGTAKDNERNASSCSRMAQELNALRRETEECHERTRQLQGLLALGHNLKSAVSRQWFKRPSVRAALALFSAETHHPD
jgi:hypothetical protein